MFKKNPKKIPQQQKYKKNKKNEKKPKMGTGYPHFLDFILFVDEYKYLYIFK